MGLSSGKANTLTNLGRSARRSRNRHRVDGDSRDDVNQRHQPVVFMVEAVAMHHVKTGIFVEPGADRRTPGSITLSSPCIVGAGALALSIANLSGPVRRPIVGSKYSITWKSLTWMWIGCSSLLWLTNLHS